MLMGFEILYLTQSSYKKCNQWESNLCPWPSDSGVATTAITTTLPVATTTTSATTI
jgi:hypothetical protein